MHFRLVANNNPRIWTKHAGVDVDPQENDRLLEARARLLRRQKPALRWAFEPLGRSGYVGKSRAHAKKRLLQQKAAKRHPPFWSFAYALSVYMVIALEFRDVLLEPVS